LCLFSCSRGFWWSAWVLLFGWRRYLAIRPHGQLPYNQTNNVTWFYMPVLFCVTNCKRMTLSSLAQYQVCQHFLRRWSITLRKLSRNDKPLRLANHTDLLPYLAPGRPCTPHYNSLLQCFQVSRDSPVIANGFIEIVRSQLGGTHQRIGRSHPQSVNTRTHCSYGHRKRVHRTPVGAPAVSNGATPSTTSSCYIKGNAASGCAIFGRSISGFGFESVLPSTFTDKGCVMKRTAFQSLIQ